MSFFFCLFYAHRGRDLRRRDRGHPVTDWHLIWSSRQGAIRLEDAPKHPPVLIRIIPADGNDCIGDEKRCM